jgi:hypothetical protein
MTDDSDHDVRDLRGRFERLISSIVIGMLLAVPIAGVLLEFVDAEPSAFTIPVFLAAGCGTAVGINALLGALVRSWRRREPELPPRVWIPRARVLRRR